MVYVDPIVVSPRTDIPLSLPSASLDNNLVIKNAGAVHIRSIYDSNMLAALISNNLPAGTSLPVLASGRADINSLAQANPDTLPVRFVRIISPMPTYDNNTIPNYKFGINGRRMRAILGYSAVEPDGSVYLEVPAEVPFAIELLDKDGRKLANRFHENWMHVISGETKTCNGCHEGHSEAESATLNTGFAAAGVAGVISTAAQAAMDPAHVAFAQGGDTMAEVRAANDPLYGELKRDLVYADYWNTPGKTLYDTNCAACHGAAGAGGSAVAIAGDTVNQVNTALANIPEMQSISLTANEIQQIVDYLGNPYASFFEVEYNDSNLGNGADGLTGFAPIVQPGGVNCTPTNYADPADQPPWTSECLILIDYEQHIQPLWEATRTAGACTDCHSTTDSMGALKDPTVETAAQLDLTRVGPRFFTGNGDNDNRFTSYDELVVQSQEIELNMAGDMIVGATDTIQVDDGMGNLVPQDVPRAANFERPVNSSLARNTHLIRILTGTETTATVDHSQMMTKAEIRVLSEWIDIGTQYYNNSALAVGP
jgi:mono/diheme cytochrome c family protein